MERFIIAGTQRTGTSLIDSTLASHPDIHCLGEVFHFRKGRGKRTHGSYRQYLNRSRWRRTAAHYINRRKLITEYLDDLYDERDAGATGFKFMLSQAQQFPQAVSYIRDHGVRILHVVRENALKTLVSRVSARRRQLYHTKEPVAVDKIHLPTSTLRWRLNAVEAEVSAWKKLVQGNPYEMIYYETLLADRQGELRKILAFLKVGYRVDLTSKLRKINPDDLSKVIENYDEVEKCLRGTRFEKYL